MALGERTGKGFCIAKSQLTSETLLVHFDPTLQPALSCDASPYGLGAVPHHICFSFISSCREKVFSVRKRGISNSLWGQEIPPVLVWAEICGAF